MKPYYEDERVTLFHGDCLGILQSLPDLSVDLVLTDHNMPGMTALVLAQRLGELAPGLPVVVTSGYVTEDLRTAALAALQVDRRAAREHAERFSWRACTEQFLAHLHPFAARG